MNTFIEPGETAAEISLSEQAYQRIKRGILDLSYPPGSDLTEAMLSAELGMSRMPVRTALHRLENEGWVLADFRKKTKVAKIFPEDIIDIYNMRSLLELPALDRIFESGKTWDYSYIIEEGLLRIKAVRHDLYLRERAETNLHMAIISVLDNRRIERIYQNVQDEMIRIGLSFVIEEEESSNTYIDNIIAGWEEIVLAMRANDHARTREIFDRDHISGALALALKHIKNKRSKEN